VRLNECKYHDCLAKHGTRQCAFECERPYYFTDLVNSVEFLELHGENLWKVRRWTKEEQKILTDIGVRLKNLSQRWKNR
jgi:hypothetical protein